MKYRCRFLILWLGLGVLMLGLFFPSGFLVQAQDTDTPVPTSTPYTRPQMALDSYSLNVSAVRYGEEFKGNHPSQKRWSDASLQYSSALCFY